MKNLKIKKTLLIGFGSIVAISLIIVICSIYSLSNVAGKMQSMYDKPYQAVNLMWEVKKEIVTVEQMLYKGIASKDKIESKTCVDSNVTSMNLIKENMNKLKQICTAEKEQELVDEINNLLELGAPIRNRINQLILNGKDKEALEVIENEYNPIFDQAMQEIHSLSELISQNADDFIKNSNLASDAAIAAIVVLLILGLIVTVIIIFKITRLIISPIQEIVFAMQELAKGDLKVEIKYESSNEFGVLADSTRETIHELRKYIEIETQVLSSLAKKDMTVKIEEDFRGDFKPIQDSLNDIIDFLNDMIYFIKDVADKVHGASGEVAGIAQSLAASASEEAASTQEIAATVNEVAQNVENNAEYAKNVNEISQNSSAKIDEGKLAMQKLLNSMQDIAAQAEKISDIICIINDIAEKTSLLSLNASIEAARAGEKGKGFAVVAGEIGKLAQESAAAAKNIENLIHTSKGVVEKGSATTDEAAMILNMIVESVKKTSVLVEEITGASKNQAVSLEQILYSANSVAEGASTNSATAQEASAASEELLAQAELLGQILEEYKLKINK